MSLQPKIDVVLTDFSLAEGPHWDARRQELIFVDIFDNYSFNRYVPANRQHNRVVVDASPTFIIPTETVGVVDGCHYITAIEKNIELIKINWDDSEPKATRLKNVVTVEKELTTRINDGKCDPQGRLWTGTMGQLDLKDPNGLDNMERGQGKLYKLDTDTDSGPSFTSQWDKVGISNGLTWSTDSTKFFYNDSLTLTVDVFDFDPTEGTLSNRQVLYDFKKNGVQGLPDGLTTDVSNNIFVASCMGSKVLHIDSTTGQLISQLDFTGRASRVTSVAFGGPNLDTLFVTSGHFGLSQDVNERVQMGEGDAGALFEVTNLGTRGHCAGVSYKGKGIL